MTTPVDIANRALSKIASQSMIASLDEASPEAVQCKLWYNDLREQLLRAAAWGFARRQVSLTLLGQLEDLSTPFPFLYKYAYPSDCLKFRYLIPAPIFDNSGVAPQVGVGLAGPVGFRPSRQYRWLINEDVDGSGNLTKTLLTNVPNAIGIYTMDVTNCDRFDSLFKGALQAALAAELAMPLSGDLQLRQASIASADTAIQSARAIDANEAIPSSDHVVDWMSARCVGPYTGLGYGGYGGDCAWGNWYAGNDAMNWGM